jgi:hypothetical protein
MPLLLVLAFLGWAICSRIAGTAIGLPLDDAYIFKRYALNLASGLGFSFNPHEPSLGCSSFLWTVLLAGLVKIFGKENYFALAQSAGIFFTAMSIYFMLRLLLDYTSSWLLVFTGAFLAWFSGVTFMNAVSGMENGLFSFLVLFNIYEFQKYESSKTRGALKMGVLSGLAFLTRPEGLYFAVAIGCVLLWQFFRRSRLKFFQLLIFALGFFVLAGPYLWWMHHTFHQFLPYTFLAKIYSSDPSILARAPARKISDGFWFLLSGWHLLIKPWKIVGWILGLFALCGVGYAAVEFFRKQGSAAFALLAGWLFLPFAYGYKFPITPHFGGYYQRYISSVWLVMVLLGLAAIHKIYMGSMPKLGRMGCVRKPLYLLGFILFLIYCWPIARGQVRAGKGVFKAEVELNQSLRKSASDWLNLNTARDAKVLVGYTGLGVVGGETERYVYDIGALINPDFFPCLQGKGARQSGGGRWEDISKYVSARESLRWQDILKYICAKQIDYFVSFASPLGPDPGKSEGFKEVARLGTAGEPASSHEQIRIYRIELKTLCKQFSASQ